MWVTLNAGKAEDRSVSPVNYPLKLINHRLPEKPVIFGVTNTYYRRDPVRVMVRIYVEIRPTDGNLVKTFVGYKFLRDESKLRVYRNA